MGKAARRKGKGHPEPDLTAVLAAGICIHCRRRPRIAGGSIWCVTCVREAQGAPKTNPPTLLVFALDGSIRYRSPDLTVEDVQDVIDLLETDQPDHPEEPPA